jgi:hypothetical protein
LTNIVQVIAEDDIAVKRHEFFASMFLVSRVEKKDIANDSMRRSSGISQIIATVAGCNNSPTCGPIKIAPIIT